MEYLINSKGNPWIFGFVFFGGGVGGIFRGIWGYFGRCLGGKRVENY